MSTIRFSLRRQKKIEDALGKDFLKWLLLSLKNHFAKGIIEELDYDPISKIIHVTNVQPKTDSFFELYVLNKTYNVYNLAYKSSAG